MTPIYETRFKLKEDKNTYVLRADSLNRLLDQYDQLKITLQETIPPNNTIFSNQPRNLGLLNKTKTQKKLQELIS